MVLSFDHHIHTHTPRLAQLARSCFPPALLRSQDLVPGHHGVHSKWNGEEQW